MKKHIVFVLLIVLSAIFIDKIIEPLSVLQNIFLIQEDLADYETFHLFKDYNQVNTNILQSTMYKSNTGALALPGKKGSNTNVRYYEVDGSINDFLNLKVLSGRFIWPEDYENKVNFIVIDEKSAVKFFLNTDCIGEKLTLNSKEYYICGVYKDDDSLLGTLSRTYRDDSSLVFVPIVKPSSSKEDDEDSVQSDDTQAFGVYTILFKIKPGYTFILNKGIENYFSQNLGKEIILKNLDFEVKNNVQKIKGLKFIMFSIIAIYIMVFIFKDMNKVIAKLKKDLKEQYLKQMLNNNKFLLIKKILIYGLSLSLVFYFYNKFKFQFIIDPDIIPSSLIDIEEIRTKMSNYIVKMNTTPNYATKFEALLKNGGTIINYLVIFIFIGFLFYFNLIIKYKSEIISFVKNLLNKVIDVNRIKSLIIKTPKSRRYRRD